jgi:hypothetical protein
MSTKIINLISKLPAYANKSPINHKHSAVLLKNGTPIIFGYNKIIGNKTMHAECDVIRRFLLSKGLKLVFREKCVLWREGII